MYAMPTWDIYSKRGTQLPDVNQFETLPGPLRVQIQRIIREMFTLWDSNTCAPGLYSILHEALAQEYGLAVLADGKDAKSRVQAFLAKTDDIEHVLDAIEVALRLADQHQQGEGRLEPSEAIKELNHRLREHGVGYQIEGSTVIRVDSTYIHKEVVRPALTVLRAPNFENAEAEFRNAHQHYRYRRYEEANAGCLMALESTLKVICQRCGWQFDADKDTASRLTDIVFKEGLIPDYLRSQFGALRSVLESGVPTIRNRAGGHGAGVKRREVPEYLASYTLHLTAAAILFLAEAEALLLTAASATRTRTTSRSS